MELLPEVADSPCNDKSDSIEAENITSQINSQTEILVGRVSDLRCGHKVQEAKTDCNENCRKRSLSTDYSVSESKKQRLVDEKTNNITQSLRDVRVGSVDSMMDSGEVDSVCSETCGLRDVKLEGPAFIKERQMSMDSTRDSGIGESSREVEGDKARTSTDEENEADVDGIDDDDDDDDGTCWQPKQKISVSKRLPGRMCEGLFSPVAVIVECLMWLFILENTYFFISPNRYVFQGAEVYSTTTKIKKSDMNSRESDDVGSDSDSEMSDADNL